jgi:hypothetical protein
VTSRRPSRAFATGASTTDPATTARTAIAATHSARLILPGGISEDVGYLDDEGEPLLLMCANMPALRGPACLAVDAGPQRRVLLGGTLHPAALQLSEVLGDHEPCFIDARHAGPLQVVRLAVDEIRVEDGCRRSIVTCASYAAAEPDLWVAFAATVAQHLDSDHANALAQLARLHLPGEQVVVAAIAALQPEALTLDVVTPDGAARLRLSLYARVDDPHELCGRLLELTAPRGEDEQRPEDR